MSVYSAALNFFTSWLLAINIVIVQWNRWSEPADALVIAERTVAIAQIFGSVVFTGMTGAFICFYTTSRYWSSTVSVTIIFSLLAFTCAYIAYYAKFFFEYGTFAGILSSLFTGIVWLPQIVILYRNKGPGQLSLILVTFEAFGSILVVFYQAFMVREHWSTWISTLVLSLEQCLLFTLFLRYLYFTNPKSILPELGLKKQKD